jgi:hypothetical protein
MNYVDYRRTIEQALKYALEQVESSGGEIEVLEGVPAEEQATMLKDAILTFSQVL